MSAEQKSADAKVRLYAIVAPDPDERWSFAASGERIRIGRALDNDVTLSDPSVSRSHAQITLGSEQCRIEDTGSRLGVFVNGEKIAAPVALASGDYIGIGGILLRFEVDLPASAPAPPILALLSIADADTPDQTRRQAALSPGAHAIGRDSRCDVVLDDPELTPVEAIVTITPERWQIAPVAGAVATSVDGKPLTGPVAISGSERIRVAKHELRLRKPAPLEEAADAAVAGDARATAASTGPTVALHEGESKTETDPEFALMCLTTELRGMRYPLRHMVVTLGSDANCELQISTLPARALTLSRGRSHYRLRVLDSGLHVRISGGRQAPCELHKGDLIDLDGMVFRLIRRSEPFTARYEPAELEAARDALRSSVSWKHVAVAAAVLALAGLLIWFLF